MRTLIALLTVFALAACSDSGETTGPDTSTPAGTYTLVAAEDQDVPATFSGQGFQLEVISGSLALTITDITDEFPDADPDATAGDYTLRLRWGSTFDETETRTSTGIWAMSEDESLVVLLTGPGVGTAGDYEPGRIVDLAWELGNYGFGRLTFEK